MEIVSIGTHLPYTGIPHAGGDFYGRHADLLSRSHRLTVITPWTPANEAALGRPFRGQYRRVVVMPPRSRRRSSRRPVVSRALPFLTMGPFLRALLADPELATTLRRAHTIELQWFNAIALAPRLRRSLPGTRIVGVFHDVASQGYLRQLVGPGVSIPYRVLALVRLLLAVPLEWRASRALRTAVVLSEKDRALLARRGAGRRTTVLRPPLEDDEMPGRPRATRPATGDVLFVGALWRSENEDAALWLMREVWPRVRRLVPEARLTIAGADPTEALRHEADRAGDVELTGHVDSLTPLYRRAALAVAPMRFGAGVKLKTVVAMMWGVPVIATSVGAEGVEGPDVFLAVEDDASGLAWAITRALNDPAAALETAERAFEWSHDRYSTDAYRQALERLYH